MAKDKTRIPFELDSQLKTAFLNRLNLLENEYSVSEALRLAMYHMLLMDNDRLESFLDYAKSLEGVHTIFRQNLDRYKKAGVIDEDYELGDPKDFKVSGICMKKMQELAEDGQTMFFGGYKPKD